MAEDGSLDEVGFDVNCAEWMGEWIEEALELTANDNPRVDYIPCTVVDKATNEVIGNVGCTYYEDTDKIGICYFIGADYRRKGYAAEAVKAYTDYFFDHYNEKEIIATIKANNEQSYKTAEKSGFKLIETKMYKDIYSFRNIIKRCRSRSFEDLQIYFFKRRRARCRRRLSRSAWRRFVPRWPRRPSPWAT